MDTEYREANTLADLIDFYTAALAGAKLLGFPTEKDERALVELRNQLSEQERIDGRAADLRAERRGFYGAI